MHTKVAFMTCRLSDPVPAAEDLAECDQRRRRRADRAVAQGTVWAGPGRRAAHDRLASAASSPDHGVGGDGRPVPDPGGPGGTRAEEAPEVVVHPLPGR